jgi:hypothetical protein
MVTSCCSLFVDAQTFKVQTVTGHRSPVTDGHRRARLSTVHPTAAMAAAAKNDAPTKMITPWYRPASTLNPVATLLGLPAPYRVKAVAIGVPSTLPIPRVMSSSPKRFVVRVGSSLASGLKRHVSASR